MSAEEVTPLIQLVKKGDAEAARKIVELFLQPLKAFARRKLGGINRAPQDEEDAALSALKSFFKGVEQQKFTELDNQQDLLDILFLLTARKAVDYIKRELARKRGGADKTVSLETEGLDQVFDWRLQPQIAAEIQDEIQRLLKILPDDDCRKVVMCKMEGQTNPEIAETLDCSLRTVERKLELIRAFWPVEIEK